MKKVAIGFSAPEEIGQKEKNILFVGRIDRRKNLIQLLNVWEKIIKDDSVDSAWQLIILGNRGNDDDAWQKLSQLKLDYPERILHHKNQDDESRNNFYSRSSIAIVPSLYESFGMVAVEAALHGCVVIAKNVGGLPEVLGPKGLFFISDAELYELITKVINTPQVRRQQTKIIRQSVSERYSNEKMVTSIINAFS